MANVPCVLCPFQSHESLAFPECTTLLWASGPVCLLLLLPEPSCSPSPGDSPYWLGKPPLGAPGRSQVRLLHASLALWTSAGWNYLCHFFLQLISTWYQVLLQRFWKWVISFHSHGALIKYGKHSTSRKGRLKFREIKQLAWGCTAIECQSSPPNPVLAGWLWAMGGWMHIGSFLYVSPGLSA